MQVLLRMGLLIFVYPSLFTLFVNMEDKKSKINKREKNKASLISVLKKSVMKKRFYIE